MQQEWKEDKKENKLEEYIRHKHGRAEFSQRFECMVELRNNKCVVHHKKGIEIEICSAKTYHLQCHGECNERQMKASWGIEYDVERAEIWCRRYLEQREFDRRDSMFQWRCDDRIETKRIR